MTPPASGISPEIYAKLRDIFRRVFDRPDMEIFPESTSKTIAGWDSFRFVDLISAIETEFEIDLSGDQIDEITCVGDFAVAIAESI